MVEKKKINVGLIGYKFMGKAHSHAYRDLPFYFENSAVPVLKTVAGRNPEGVKKASEHYGFQGYTTNWKNLLEDEEIDLIDIVTPNNTHVEMTIAAARAGKHILCEKPLAMTTAEAYRILETVKENNVVHMICHNYRYTPAVQMAKKLIEEGKLGKIYHIRAHYLQDWIMDPKIPLVWRLKKEVTGYGAHGDIGAHIIDLARFLIGEFSEVTGMMQTFIKERPISTDSDGLSGSTASDKTGQVDVDDATAFLAKFSNGAFGVFEATRFAGGNRNGNRFEINGEKGSIRWDMENMNNLEVYFDNDPKGLQGFRTINCTEEVHPFAGAYWPPGHIIGYEHTFINLLKTLIDGISEGIIPTPNFEDGLLNQAVLEAVEKSAEKGTWISIKEVLEQAKAESCKHLSN
ncbi:Gfo/Idh/MocA family oxidoreductase [Bacillus sp. IB182487]|uniref:Gfo/Idh/MocA family oxidoreductase n=1 Tax=Metabacillus arenae TaxID=2771434 RepID=A0A926NRE9_9BACI|nr:Gfo/Idh/MocA family oxidoreductase [Metabacillus arenae]MBD1382536.1 Gfo/Idh/MocA family oxidoreductase [Metabacillus arenae]